MISSLWRLIGSETLFIAILVITTVLFAVFVVLSAYISITDRRENKSKKGGKGNVSENQPNRK